MLMLQPVMAAESVLLLVQDMRANSVCLLAIMTVTGSTAVRGHRLPDRIPAENEAIFSLKSR